MPNDFVTIKALAGELSDMLSGGKINKIYMPEKDEVTISVRARGENYLLCISTNPQNPRMHLTTEKKENPPVAPGFCMYLRKYFTGGTITDIGIMGEDRIISLNVTSRNEMHDEINISLVAEMMGRYSNLIAVDNNGNIGAAIKQVPFDTATKRCILPGIKYSAPPQSKIPPSDKSALAAALESYNGGKLSLFIAEKFAGYSKLTAAFAVKLAGLDDNAESLSEKDAAALLDALGKLDDVYASPLFSPCCLKKGEEYTDYFVCPYGDGEYESFPTLSRCIERATAAREKSERHREHTRELNRYYKNFIAREEKKLAKSRARLKECEDTEYCRKCGDLITINLYAIKRGDKVLSAIDVYDPEGKTVEVELDPSLSPQQNAQAYYKKYAKLKRTFVAVSRQIEETLQTLDYARDIGRAIEMCSTSAEYAEIESELAQLGAIRKKRALDKRMKPAKPLEYAVDGYKVLVGKNNLQNERITFKIAQGGDIWMHAKDAHGSHLIIICSGEEVPEKTLAVCAEIAAYYSQSAQADKVTVDYTRRKRVKRHPSGKPALVVYTEYKSLSVKPCAHTELLTDGK